MCEATLPCVLHRGGERLDFPISFQERLIAERRLQHNLLPLRFKFLPPQIQLHRTLMRVGEPVRQCHAAPQDRATAVIDPPPVIVLEMRTRM